jgi:hypothetical protein
MSILAALDYFYKNKFDDYVEVEYRLLSWGEIYSPFLGDREHSTSAQFILREYPFKLFSVSTPYSEIPQKLCLTFRAPIQTEVAGRSTSTGPKQDTIAKEFTALLSLITRRRIFATGQTRASGLPIEATAEFYTRSHQQERQQLKEIDPEFIYKLLNNLQVMDRQIAESYVLAMRLYHSAIEMMYTEPDFAYLFLVMSLEAISSAVNKDLSLDKYDDEELEQYLNSSYPGWKNFSTPESRPNIIQMLLSNKVYLTGRKFRDFIISNLPDFFWTETEDDAKPDYYNIFMVPGENGFGREELQHSEKVIREYEKIEKTKLKRTLDEIYKARSKLVHEGKRLPASIMIGHFRRLPFDAFSELIEQASEARDASLTIKLPPLITLERLVSYTLVEYLRRQG